MTPFTLEQFPNIQSEQQMNHHGKKEGLIMATIVHYQRHFYISWFRMGGDQHIVHLYKRKIDKFVYPIDFSNTKLTQHGDGCQVNQGSQVKACLFDAGQWVIRNI